MNNFENMIHLINWYYEYEKNAEGFKIDDAKLLYTLGILNVKKGWLLIDSRDDSIKLNDGTSIKILFNGINKDNILSAIKIAMEG